MKSFQQSVAHFVIIALAELRELIKAVKSYNQYSLLSVRLLYTRKKRFGEVPFQYLSLNIIINP